MMKKVRVRCTVRLFHEGGRFGSDARCKAEIISPSAGGTFRGFQPGNGYEYQIECPGHSLTFVVSVDSMSLATHLPRYLLALGGVLPAFDLCEFTKMVRWLR